MATSFDPDRDLTISRVIEAPRDAVWEAWSNPRRFESWWIPAPTACRATAFDLRPGGAFETEMTDESGDWVPHISGCFVAVDPVERIVFTTALVGGWRPAVQPFITAFFTFEDHPDGTLYTATAKHKDAADRAMHEELGFYEGWSAVTEQLAALAPTLA